MRDGGVSPVIGGILVFLIAIVSIALFLFWGAPLIEELGANTAYNTGIVRFRELETSVGNLIGAGQTTVVKWTPELDRGELAFHPRGGRFLVEADLSDSRNATYAAWEDVDSWLIVNLTNTTAGDGQVLDVKAWRVDGTSEVELLVNQSALGDPPAPAFATACSVTDVTCSAPSGTDPCGNATFVNATAYPWAHKVLCFWDKTTGARFNLTGAVVKIVLYAGGTAFSKAWIADVGHIRYSLGPTLVRHLYFEGGTLFRGEPTIVPDGSIGIKPPVGAGGGKDQFIRLLQLQASTGGGSLSGRQTYFFTSLTNVALAQEGNVSGVTIYVDGPLRGAWLPGLTDGAGGYDYKYVSESFSPVANPWKTGYVHRFGNSLPFSFHLQLTRISVQN